MQCAQHAAGAGDAADMPELINGAPPGASWASAPSPASTSSTRLGSSGPWQASPAVRSLLLCVKGFAGYT